MPNGDHDGAPAWKILASAASLASVAWGVIKSFRESRPTVGVEIKPLAFPPLEVSVLDRLESLERDHAELRREQADDRKAAEQRHQQIFALLLKIRGEETGH